MHPRAGDASVGGTGNCLLNYTSVGYYHYTMSEYRHVGIISVIVQGAAGMSVATQIIHRKVTQG